MTTDLLLQDEIDRKTVEALERVVTEFESKLLTAREARIAIRAVFESVQGLLTESISEILNQVMTQFANEPGKPIFPMHLAMPGGNTIFISVDLDDKTMRVLNVTTGAELAKVACDTQTETIKKAAAFAKNAIVKGAIKL
ncbi:hypothetical protein ABVY06_003516 [Escherichia coli]